MKKPVVVITRPEERARETFNLVKEFGGIPLIIPTLSLEPFNSDSLKELVSNIGNFDWIIFTSPTTFDSIYQFYPFVFDNLNCNVAVIGAKSADVAGKYNLNVDLIPSEFTSEGLLEEFKSRGIINKKIAIPRTFSARDTLPIGLKELGNDVFVAEAYKSFTPKNKENIMNLLNKLYNDEIDAITFTSPLTVENLFNEVSDKKKLASKLSDIITVAIGPITGNKLENYGVNYIFPENYTVKDMLELLFEKWGVLN